MHWLKRIPAPSSRPRISLWSRSDTAGMFCTFPMNRKKKTNVKKQKVICFMEQCPVGKKAKLRGRENQHKQGYGIRWDTHPRQTTKKSQVNSQLFRFWLFFYWLGSYVYRCRGKACRLPQTSKIRERAVRGKHTHQRKSLWKQKRQRPDTGSGDYLQV